MKKILSGFAIMGALALGMASAQAQNVLGNAGFETLFPDPTTSIGDWATFNSDTAGVSQGTTDPHSGTRHLILETGAENQFAGAYQDIDVPVSAGTEVTFSGWHKAITSPVGSNNEIKFEWTGSPTEVITENAGSDYSQFSFTRIAPAGVTDLRITYAIATFGAGLGDSTVYLDDMSLSVKVPEPATAGGLVVALAALAGFRRRK